MNPLDLGHRLLEAGIPVVVVGPNDIPRQAWRGIRDASQCDLSLYREGDALMMLCGHGLDVVDVDAKEGGSLAHLPAFTYYGVTRTPSGGAHYVVPSTGIGKMRLSTDLGPVGDYCGGRKDFSARLPAFLPGSVRTKYPDGGYEVEVEWDIEGALAARPDPDLVLALLDAGGTLEQPVSGYADTSPRRQEAGLHPQAEAVRDRELTALDELAAEPWSPGAHWDDRVFRAACVLVRLANSAWSGYALEDAHADLLEHAPADEEWGKREHEVKWSSAVTTVGDEGLRPPSTAEDDFGPLADDFWSSTPELEHIQTAARSRLLAPEMLLAMVLLRVLMEVPQTTMLPATVGSRAPLNLGVACVGRSGGGKSSAFSVSRELLGLDGLMQADCERVLGTGEGLIEAFLRPEYTTDGTGKKVKTGRKVLIEDPRLLFTVGEVDQLKAVKDRAGSSIAPVLRSALSGEVLGQTNADPERRRHVVEGTYRACLSIGVQPTRSQTLLEDTDAGTPQRLLWVDETDPLAPEEVPDWPGELQVSWPATWPSEIDCTEEFAQAIRSARRARLLGEGDPVQGHRLLTQHKVAAALAVLHGETVASERWLELAGQLVARSFAVQQMCRQALNEEMREKALARARESGHAQVVLTETVQVETAKVDKLKTRMHKKVRDSEDGVALSELRKTAVSRERTLADRALALLVAEGVVVVETVDAKGSRRVRAVETT